MGSNHVQRMAWLSAAIVMCGCDSRVPHGDRLWCQARVVIRNGSDPLNQAEAVFIADESSGGVDAGGPLNTEGAVEIPVLPGTYTLIVRPLQEEVDRDAGKPAVGSLIPARVQAAGTSPYHVEVIKGTKPVFTIDLAAPRP